MASALNERESNRGDSKKKEESPDKSYLDLVGFVSHELKGVLSSIVLNVYSLKNGLLGPVNEAQKKTLKSISRNLDYLTGTVRNFLNLSRVEKGEISIKVRSLKLKAQIIASAFDSFRQMIDEKNMRFIEKIDEEITVKADTDLIQVVVNNLLSNALKYGSLGGDIIISAGKRGEAVDIEVYNDGHPIDRVDLDKLFKKFSRLLYEGEEKTKGSGIGLFIAREIMLQHGGDIKAEPREKGNAFIFSIPAV